MTQFDGWDAAEEKLRTGERVQADVYEANRGGLIVKLLGLRAFLPASQVATDMADRWVRTGGNVAGPSQDQGRSTATLARAMAYSPRVCPLCTSLGMTFGGSGRTLRAAHTGARPAC